MARERVVLYAPWQSLLRYLPVINSKLPELSQEKSYLRDGILAQAHRVLMTIVYEVIKTPKSSQTKEHHFFFIHNRKYLGSTFWKSDFRASINEVWADFAELKAVSVPACHELALISAITSWIGTPGVSKRFIGEEKKKMSNGINRILIVTKRSKSNIRRRCASIYANLEHLQKFTLNVFCYVLKDTMNLTLQI